MAKNKSKRATFKRRAIRHAPARARAPQVSLALTRRAPGQSIFPDKSTAPAARKSAIGKIFGAVKKIGAKK